MKFLAIVFASIILLSAIAAASPRIDSEKEPLAGATDKTVIWRELVEERDDSYIIALNIASRDNNHNPDANGGKLVLLGADLLKVKELGFEYDCTDEAKQNYECYRIKNDNVFQWFNYADNEEDKLQLILAVPKGMESSALLIDIGGMECGAYNQNYNQIGGYQYNDCTANKTFIGMKNVGSLATLPIHIVLNEEQACSGTVLPEEGRAYSIQPSLSKIGNYFVNIFYKFIGFFTHKK